MFDCPWEQVIVAIYFFYGLAFYSMGLALLVESGRSSELTLARPIRLLAGFGLLHGIHEWIDMARQGGQVCRDVDVPTWVTWLQLALLVVSFLGLLAFGENLLQTTYHWRFTLGAWGFYIFSSVAIYLVYGLNDQTWLAGLDVLARYIIGIPGAIFACLALWRQRPIFRARGMDSFARDLTVAAIALALYGGVGQLFVQKSDIFPSQYINAALFQNITGFPIQLLRAVMAIFIAVAMIRVLRSLDVENEQRLLAIEQAKLDAEQRSREELTRLNAQLQQLHARRGELLQRITAAQESERRRIARELHDGTGQALTGMAMGLRGMVMSQSENGALTRRLSDLEKMATNAVGELRHLINDLRPPQLDDMGLAAGLRWLADTFNSRGTLHVELEIHGTPVHLPNEVETTLFRIAQEGLTNITKHAKAFHAWISLNFDETITLTVRDDGIGFDASAMLNAKTGQTSWGLVGMQERATLINAVLTFESAPGWGTVLKIQLDTHTIGE